MNHGPDKLTNMNWNVVNFRGTAVRSVTFLLIGVILLGGCSLGSGKKAPTATTIAVSTATPGSLVASPSNQTNPIQTGSPTAVVSASPTAQTPKPTGTQSLTFSGGSLDPQTLDPALIQDLGSSEIARQVFRGLVKLTPKLTAVPDLADKIDLSQDQKTYTFHLRKGIEFSSGTPIYASDVQYSLNRALDPALKAQTGGVLPALIFLSDIQGATDRSAGKADQISGIQVVDKLTIKITLNHPVADFLVKLAGTPASVVSKDDVAKGGEWWRSPDASGPFTIGTWNPGSEIVLKANPHYLPEPPTLQTVTILYGAQASNSLALYERNQVDFSPAPIDAIDRLQAANSPYRNQLVSQPQLSTSYILLNPNIAPFNNIDVRKAVIMAFDRTKIATVTFDGHVQVANSIVPQGLDGVDWTATLPKYDPTQAAALLKQTSLDPKNSGMVFYSAADYSPVALKLQLQQNLGVNSDVVQEQWPVYLRDIAAQRLPALSFGWIADYPGPEDFLRELFYSTSDENPIGYHNAAVDKLLDQADQEPDAAKRAALYKQAQQLIIDDAVVIPLYTDIDYELVQSYVHGLPLTPVGLLGLESVWLTK